MAKKKNNENIVDANEVVEDSEKGIKKGLQNLFDAFKFGTRQMIDNMADGFRKFGPVRAFFNAVGIGLGMFIAIPVIAFRYMRSEIGYDNVEFKETKDNGKEQPQKKEEKLGKNGEEREQPEKEIKEPDLKEISSQFGKQAFVDMNRLNDPDYLEKIRGDVIADALKDYQICKVIALGENGEMQDSGYYYAAHLEFNERGKSIFENSDISGIELDKIAFASEVRFMKEIGALKIDSELIASENGMADVVAFSDGFSIRKNIESGELFLAYGNESISLSHTDFDNLYEWRQVQKELSSGQDVNDKSKDNKLFENLKRWTEGEYVSDRKEYVEKLSNDIREDYQNKWKNERLIMGSMAYAMMLKINNPLVEVEHVMRSYLFDNGEYDGLTKKQIFDMIEKINSAYSFELPMDLKKDLIGSLSALDDYAEKTGCQKIDIRTTLQMYINRDSMIYDAEMISEKISDKGVKLSKLDKLSKDLGMDRETLNRVMSYMEDNEFIKTQKNKIFLCEGAAEAIESMIDKVENLKSVLYDIENSHYYDEQQQSAAQEERQEEPQPSSDDKTQEEGKGPEEESENTEKEDSFEDITRDIEDNPEPEFINEEDSIIPDDDMSGFANQLEEPVSNADEEEVEL